MQRFRSPIAFLILLLFVFPFFQKAAHDLEHIRDFHCITKTQWHFHNTEHDCSLCDITITPSLSSLIIPEVLVSFPEILFQFPVYPENFPVQPSFSFSSRGPPSV